MDNTSLYHKAQRPSQETCSTNYLNTHPTIADAEADATRLYLIKPIKNQQLRQYIIRNWKMADFGQQNSAVGKQVLSMNNGNSKFKQLVRQFEQKANEYHSTNNNLQQVMRVHTPRINAYNKTVAATKNGSYADLIAIYAQFRPQK